MPGGEDAIVDLEKLTEYCLSPEHPRGRHKARVFASVLGLTATMASDLRRALLAAAGTRDAQQGTSDEFGIRYVVDFEMQGPKASAVVVSAWSVRRGETRPRLTSCYVR
jgi:hypothetical protein